MNDFKKDVIKYTVCGLLIFSIGLFIGNALNSNSINKIQGYLLGASYDDEDDELEYDESATDSNATDSNATDCNATSGDVCDDCNDGDEEDDVVYLDSITFKNSRVKAGDTVYLEIETYGAKLNGITITLMNNNTKSNYSITVKDVNNNPYIIIPKYLQSGTYEITDVLLTGISSDDTTFSRHYSSSNENNTYSLDFSSSIYVTSFGNIKPITMSSISIKTNKAALGDNVEMILKTNDKLISGKLTFINDKNEIMLVSLFTGENSSFYVPSTAKTGKYKLTEVSLMSENSSVIYTLDGSKGTKKYNFNIEIEIVNSTNDKYVYNNEDINNEIITKIYNSEVGSTITINTDTNAIIKEELFDSIKGKKKKLVINNSNNQIIFEGKNIKNSKTIDAGIEISVLEKNSDINKLVNEGYVINFADNGDLPGEALVRIKSNEDLSKQFGEDKINIYYFNKNIKKFSLINSGVKKTSDGYYEFNISHNSEYLMSNKKLDDSLVTVIDDNNVVGFQLSKKSHLLLIGVGVLVVIIIGIVFAVINKKQSNKIENNTNTEEQKDIKNN